MRRALTLLILPAILMAASGCKQAGAPPMANAHSDSQPPADVWDDRVAAEVVGKIVLIGLTHPAHGVAPVNYEQLHGRIVSADRKQGFRIELEGLRSGEDFWLPPQTNTFVKAKPGTYRLRSTGEEVENPDYTSNWTINPPSS